MQVIHLPLEQVQPDPKQPRQFFGKEELGNLAANIAEHGVLEPILVRTDGVVDGVDSFIIIAGERRWRASKIAGVSHIPAIVRDDITTAGTLDEVAISENTSRQDLNPMEEARAFARLREERGFDVDAIAAKIGRSPSFVWMRFALLDLDDDIARLVEVGQMGALTGATIARLPKSHQYLAIRAMNEGRGIGDNALKMFVDEVLARINQPEMFGEEQAPARSHEVRTFRERFEKALDSATAAINTLVDAKTNTIMIEAINDDFDIFWERLRLLEQECRRIRSAIQSAKATSSALKENLLS